MNSNVSPAGVCFSYNMQENRISRWYFGGVSSSAAACLTHPLDLIKVHLQTQQEVRLRMIGMTVNVVRREGYLALYSGLSASLCRQMTYSLSRFAIYETIRDRINRENKTLMPFYQKVLLGAFGGFAGGLIGTPADLVNVRMQNDVKLPAELRRNYAHVLDGLLRVWKEGIFKLFSGATMASVRGALVSIGQLSCYDQSKQLVLATGYFTDNILTHFLASVFAGGCAIILCQPLDVVKTRIMNSKLEYRSVLHCLTETAKLGPKAFYKGLVPAAIRLIPQTVFTFIFLEQLKQHFGLVVVT
ncbi:mitochondrial dicarboxylate carrier isoform X2 [Kryptolebias marmoratus]|uniref:mitochondrial dicarboxylate carrier isoform X2 n=1 Tax=Kryptolebias marmoratus TaxID=37003 RepID=UPI0007F8AE22|nr:mitochondrial dicarboxylate carrier isoform X2 [Kryptolebias marmoratus]